MVRRLSGGRTSAVCKAFVGRRRMFFRFLYLWEKVFMSSQLFVGTGLGVREGIYGREAL
jgi:hypothetical protein